MNKTLKNKFKRNILVAIKPLEEKGESIPPIIDRKLLNFFKINKILSPPPSVFIHSNGDRLIIDFN